MFCNAVLFYLWFLVQVYLLRDFSLNLHFNTFKKKHTKLLVQKDQCVIENIDNIQASSSFLI